MIEYRICWSAGSNISFKGATDWNEYGGFEETPDEIEAEMCNGGQIPQGLEEALEVSGFEWWIETRERESADV